MNKYESSRLVEALRAPYVKAAKCVSIADAIQRLMQAKFYGPYTVLCSQIDRAIVTDRCRQANVTFTDAITNLSINIGLGPSQVIVFQDTKDVLKWDGDSVPVVRVPSEGPCGVAEVA